MRVVPLGAVALVGALALCGCSTKAEPPVFMNAPTFELVDHRGNAFRSVDLKGKIWVVDFFFTSCPSICPRLTAAMKEVRGELEDHAGQIRYVSISVDPLNDTPEVLRRYAERNDLELSHWSLLTGDEKVVRETVADGFKTFLGEREQRGGQYDIAHASRFFLVDQAGRVRGAYAIDDDGKKSLIGDIRRLLE